MWYSATVIDEVVGSRGYDPTKSSVFSSVTPYFGFLSLYRFFSTYGHTPKKAYIENTYIVSLIYVCTYTYTHISFLMHACM